MELLILDIDGTVADNSQRMPPLSEGGFSSWKETDWAEFYSREKVLCDQPIPYCVPVLRSYEGRVVYLTGREAKAIESTLDWFALYGFPYQGSIFYREDGDFRKAPELKEQRLKEILEVYDCETKIAIDDDVEIHPIYEKYGFKVFTPSIEFWKSRFDQLLTKKYDLRVKIAP